MINYTEGKVFCDNIVKVEILFVFTIFCKMRFVMLIGKLQKYPRILLELFLYQTAIIHKNN